MKLFCDHEELINQLKLERDSLKLRVAYLEKLTDSLRESLTRIAAQEKKVSQPVPITKEDIAQRLHIPASMIEHIDLTRLGIQLEANGVQSQRR